MTVSSGGYSASNFAGSASNRTACVPVWSGSPPPGSAIHRHAGQPLALWRGWGVGLRRRSPGGAQGVHSRRCCGKRAFEIPIHARGIILFGSPIRVDVVLTCPAKSRKTGYGVSSLKKVFKIHTLPVVLRSMAWARSLERGRPEPL